MTGEVGECNCHLVQPEQDGIDRCPHICSVRHLASTVRRAEALRFALCSWHISRGRQGPQQASVDQSTEVTRYAKGEGAIPNEKPQFDIAVKGSFRQVG
jgi:hypothetical protein